MFPEGFAPFSPVTKEASLSVAGGKNFCKIDLQMLPFFKRNASIEEPIKMSIIANVCVTLPACFLRSAQRCGL